MNIEMTRPAEAVNERAWAEAQVGTFMHFATEGGAFHTIGSVVGLDADGFYVLSLRAYCQTEERARQVADVLVARPVVKGADIKFVDVDGAFCALVYATIRQVS
jgi:hypothetical protein